MWMSRERKNVKKYKSLPNVEPPGVVLSDTHGLDGTAANAYCTTLVQLQ